VALFLDENGFETTLQQVSHPIMAAIEPLRVDRVDAMHAAREVSFGRLEQQVVMIPHQHVGVEPPREQLDGLRKHGEKEVTVPVVAKNRPPLVAAAGDMP
jgi:hypothetical protein